MLYPAENPEGAIACAISDAHRFAQDGRPCFGLLILQQTLALALREQGCGRAWAAEAVTKVEAEIRKYRADHGMEGYRSDVL